MYGLDAVKLPRHVGVCTAMQYLRLIKLGPLMLPSRSMMSPARLLGR
jgi:hypothetical protein